MVSQGPTNGMVNTMTKDAAETIAPQNSHGRRRPALPPSVRSLR